MNEGFVVEAAVVIAIVFKALDWCGWLGWLKRKTAAEAAAELAISETVNHRLRAERDAALSKANVLEQTRSLEPILMLVQEVLGMQQQTLGTQQQTLDKLAHFNGALKRQEEALRAATEALKMVAGFVVGANELPTREHTS